MTIVLQGIKQCCDEPVNPEQGFSCKENMIQGHFKRKYPSLKRQKELLDKQNNQCLYCNKPFGTPYTRNGVLAFTTVHWDHLVPYAYSQTSKDLDFVASCNICNFIKSDMVFETIEEVFRYVDYNRKKKRYSYYEDVAVEERR